jgi:hypothetical protein
MTNFASPQVVYLMAIGWRLCGIEMNSLTFALLTFAVCTDWGQVS